MNTPQQQRLKGTQDYVLTKSDIAAHSMVNNSNTDAVYLMGGNRPDIDICHYPDSHRKMYTVYGKREFVDLEDLGKL